jgi:hypothetical protein
VRLVCAVVAGGVLLAGCASGRGTPAAAGSLDFGIYQYREPVVDSRPTLVMEGTIVYQPDTIHITYVAAPCTWDKRSAGDRRIYYRCGEVTFALGRHNPLQDNSYSVITTSMTTHCDRSRPRPSHAPSTELFRRGR